MFGDIPDPADSERTRRLEAEAETDRELREGAPPKEGVLGRWRAWRMQRRHVKPPSGHEGDGAQD